MTNQAPININGFDTYFVEMSDDIGNYLLITIPPNADKSISDICGSIIAGHYICQIDYEKLNGKVAFIKAYY